MDFLDSLKEYCRRESLLDRGDRILLAVSGGPDSLAMLDLFDRLKGDLELEIGVFHLDHGLREKAAEEADFVKGFCQNRDILCWQERVDIKKIVEERGGSIEEVAREVRLDFFCQYARKKNMDSVAVGHQANDRAETVLFNLIRGAGMRGLSGITPKTLFRDQVIIRPLLEFTREQLEVYCDQRSLEPRRDKSNLSTKYDRNKIRQELIPYLENNFNSELISAINSTAELIQSENEFLNSQVERIFSRYAENMGDHRIDVPIDPLTSLHPVLRKRLWRILIRKLLGSTSGFYRRHFSLLEDILQECQKEPGGREYHLPRGIKVKELYGSLSFRDEAWRSDRGESEDFSLCVKKPDEVNLPGGRRLIFEISGLPGDWRERAARDDIAFLDAGKISWPLTVRNRRPGDRFRPLGMRGSKKIKDFFIDEKVAPHRRDKIPLVVEEKGKIVWIAGMRCDDRFKIDDETGEVLRIEYQKSE